MTAFNPSDTDVNITLSNNNLTATGTSSTTGLARSTTSKSTGKWYWEVTLNSDNSAAMVLGLCNSSAPNTVFVGGDGSVGGNTNAGVGYQPATGVVFIGAADSGAGWATIATGHVVGVLMDLTNSPTVHWQVNDNGGTPFASQNFTPQNNTGPFFAAVSPSNNTGDQMTINFGATAFANSIPAGFTRWDPLSGGGATTGGRGRASVSLPFGLLIGGGAALGRAIQRNDIKGRRSILLPRHWI